MHADPTVRRCDLRLVGCNDVPIVTGTLDEQECAAWATVAAGARDAIARLDRRHPQRNEFLEMWAECRTAAGLDANWTAA